MGTIYTSLASQEQFSLLLQDEPAIQKKKNYNMLDLTKVYSQLHVSFFNFPKMVKGPSRMPKIPINSKTVL